jgi:hypothetical protein
MWQSFSGPTGSHGNTQVFGSKGLDWISQAMVDKAVKWLSCKGFAPVTVGGAGRSVAAGVLTGDFMLRLPLDDFWPGVHLAPYFFAGLGGIIVGSVGEGHSVSETFAVTNAAGQTRDVTFTGRRVDAIRNNIGDDRVLAHFGGGLEYRITPHIGIFGEAGYDLVNGASNDFIQTNFGLRYAF